MSERRVDPVHFFTQFGDSVLSNEHLLAENRRLLQELERQKRLIEAMQRKNAAGNDQPDKLVS